MSLNPSSIVSNAPRPEPGACVRVLFADDEPSVRRAFARFAEQRGYSVDLAASGEQALRLASRTPYPVVVTDLRMPGMDGATLLRRLRWLRPDSSFVVVTGAPGVDRARSGSDALDCPVLSKPWSEAELERILRSALEGGGLPNPQNRLSLVLLDASQRLDQSVSQSLQALTSSVVYESVKDVAGALDALRSSSADALVFFDDGSDACVQEARWLAMEAGSRALIAIGEVSVATRALQLAGAGVQDYLRLSELSELKPQQLTHRLRLAIARHDATVRLTPLRRVDSLTGLLTANAFREDLEVVTSAARRNGGRFALLWVGLDDYGRALSAAGSVGADRLVRWAAREIALEMRSSDDVARIDASAFAVLVSNLDPSLQVEQIHLVSDRLMQSVTTALRKLLQRHGLQDWSTVNVGGAMFPDSSSEPQELLDRARSAYETASERGAGKLQVYVPDSPGPRSTRLGLQHNLRSALARDEFRVWYQPQLDLRTNRVEAHEALLRWQADEHTTISPVDFIGTLEETGLIGDVGAWVIEMACARLSGADPTQAAGRVAVNVSAVQFQQQDFASSVDAALRRYCVTPDRLELEITETTLMRDCDQVTRTLHALKEIGVRLAIDDFGTGYSSLAYLNRYQVDCLKIDRSFTQQITATEEAVAGAIVELGHRLGLEVVAEGVESDQQLAWLRDRGCDLVQGYLVGVPEPGPLTTREQLASRQMKTSDSHNRLRKAAVDGKLGSDGEQVA